MCSYYRDGRELPVHDHRNPGRNPDRLTFYARAADSQAVKVNFARR
jgi:hypothetical protein